MKISLSAEDKIKILSTIQIWDRSQLTQDIFRKIQSKYGIPAYLIETMFWHMEILNRLLPISEFLILKGGTCIQSYIDPMLQRASNDLDFNTIIQNPNALMQKIENLNKQLNTQGITIEIHNILYGAFEFEFNDNVSGTLNYRHRMPSRFGEYEHVANIDIQAKSIRLQINYKHAWLPVIKKVMKPMDLFIKSEVIAKKLLMFPHASIEDLIADKILTTEEHTGRERFKDIYDLMVLFNINFDKTLVIKKLTLIAERINKNVIEILKSSANTVIAFGERSNEARGFASMVNKSGKELVTNWEIGCEKIAEKILHLS